MIAHWLILNAPSPVFTADAAALARWQKAGQGLSERAGGMWQIFMLTVIGLTVLIVVAWAIMVWLEKRRNRELDDFAGQAEKLGLSPEERNLVYNVALRSGASRPAVVFTSAAAFDKGMTAIRASGGSSRKGLRPKAQICGSCPLIQSVREKLGLPWPGYQAAHRPVAVGNLAPGAAVTISCRHGGSICHAVAAGRSPDGEVLVTPADQVDCQAGENCTVRFSEGGTLWEFAAQASGVADGKLALKPTGEARSINRRRFARAQTSKPAHIAKFPFQREEGDTGAPKFVQGELIEVAGPGLKLRAPIDVNCGERIIIVTELESEKIVEAVGISRRVDAPQGGMLTFAVELVGLTTTEVSDLARQTNVVAAAGRQQQNPAAAK